jgi:hypothetical protein
MAAGNMEVDGSSQNNNNNLNNNNNNNNSDTGQGMVVTPEIVTMITPSQMGLYF